jgi:hypothetical protein
MILLVGLPLSALVLGVSGIMFDANEGFANSDCIGRCIGEFEYSAPIYGALVGGVAFVALLVAAVARLAKGPSPEPPN